MEDVNRIVVAAVALAPFVLVLVGMVTGRARVQPCCPRPAVLPTGGPPGSAGRSGLGVPCGECEGEGEDLGRHRHPG